MHTKFFLVGALLSGIAVGHVNSSVRPVGGTELEFVDEEKGIKCSIPAIMEGDACSMNASRPMRCEFDPALKKKKSEKQPSTSVPADKIPKEFLGAAGNCECSVVSSEPAFAGELYASCETRTHGIYHTLPGVDDPSIAYCIDSEGSYQKRWSKPSSRLTWESQKDARYQNSPMTGDICKRMHGTFFNQEVQVVRNKPCLAVSSERRYDIEIPICTTVSVTEGRKKFFWQCQFITGH